MYDGFIDIFIFRKENQNLYKRLRTAKIFFFSYYTFYTSFLVKQIGLFLLDYQTPTVQTLKFCHTILSKCKVIFIIQNPFQKF